MAADAFSVTPRAEDLPQVIPLFPLDGAILLPQSTRPFNIFEPRYLNMVDDAMAAERIIGVIQTVPGGSPERPRLVQIGCAGRVTSFTETPDGRYLITLTGLARFRLGGELPAMTPYRRARVDFLSFAVDLEPPSDQPGADRSRLLTSLQRYLDLRGLSIDWAAAEVAPTDRLVNSLAMALPLEPQEQQALLEAADIEARRRVLIALLDIGGTDFDAHGAGGARQ